MRSAIWFRFIKPVVGLDRLVRWDRWTILTILTFERVNISDFDIRILVEQNNLFNQYFYMMWAIVEFAEDARHETCSRSILLQMSHNTADSVISASPKGFKF